MPKYYCDYCDTYLTHDSPSVRKTHCSGRKHKENVKFYYQKWMEDQAQHLIDATTAAFKAGKMGPKPGGLPPLAAAIFGRSFPTAACSCRCGRSLSRHESVRAAASTLNATGCPSTWSTSVDGRYETRHAASDGHASAAAQHAAASCQSVKSSFINSELLLFIVHQTNKKIKSSVI
ncbi:U1 small nuclear ribonucleoprotein C [Halotydeus destructor]|nr:U1 small nuclear ribonucleoprotein C [Halotydeus destructor]